MGCQYLKWAEVLIALEYKCVAELKEHSVFLRIPRAKVVKTCALWNKF